MSATNPLEPERPRLRLRAALKLSIQGASTWAWLHGICVLVQSVLPLAGLWIMKLIVDGVAEGVRVGDGDAAFENLVPLLWLAAAVAAGGALARALSGIVTEGQTQAVHDHVHEQLHEKACAVDLADLEEPAVLDLLGRARQEAPVRPGRIVAGLGQLAQGLLGLIFMGGLLAFLDPLVALVVMAAALPGVWLRARHARVLHRWQRRRAGTDREIAYLGWLVTAPTSAKEVRLFDLGPLVRNRWRALRRAMRGERLGLAGRRAGGDLVGQIFGVAAMFGGYAFLARAVVSGGPGGPTLGDFVLYVQAIQRVQQSVQTVFGGLAGLQEDALFLSAWFAFLDLPGRLATPVSKGSRPVTGAEGITLDGVSFRYPSGGPDVLRNISLSLRPGERVALVGANGSGKSTLLKLLCRFYDPTAGGIRFGAVDVRDLDAREIRRHVAAVFQDFMRYDLSVEDNVALGRAETGPDQGRVMDALRAAGVLERIQELPDGVSTRLGRRFDGGAELSLGEWQKVAIARALYRDASIVLLDEPTSAIDPAAEEELTERLLSLTEGRTAIVVSHRLTTVRRLPRILVLDRGCLVEDGTHAELMGQDGAYARLYAAQSRPFKP